MNRSAFKKTSRGQGATHGSSRQRRAGKAATTNRPGLNDKRSCALDEPEDQK